MGSPGGYVYAFVQNLYGLAVQIFMGMTFGSPLYNYWLRCLGTHVDTEALILAPITEFDIVTIGARAVIDREAQISGQRLLPAAGGPSEFATIWAKVTIGPRCTVSHSASVNAAITFDTSVLAPLSTIGPSQELPARTLAVGSPSQKFVWSNARDNLVKPSTHPVPKELRAGTFLPQYVTRALNQMKARSADVRPKTPHPMVTGAGGYLGRYLSAALLENWDCDVVCLVRATSAEKARERVLGSLRKAGITSPAMQKRVHAVCGDLSVRHFGLPLSEFQRLAGTVTHVFNSAAKVDLVAPFESMRKDNIDSCGHVIEFCCSGQVKPLHHVSTMGTITLDMLDRHGKVPETAPLGDMVSFPMYGTGDQGNGYMYTKWIGEKMVFQAGRRGLPVFVHRAGLIGGHSQTGDMAEDVFFHFLTDVFKVRLVPELEGNKFNLTPVDFVAKGIVQIALSPSWASKEGTAIHPCLSNNTVTMVTIVEVLQEMGYTGLKWMDFILWRHRILASPDEFKSWSFCGELSSEGNGLDDMADNAYGLQAIKEAVGSRPVADFDARECLRRGIRNCQTRGMLPMPDVAPCASTSFTVASDSSRPLLQG